MEPRPRHSSSGIVLMQYDSAPAAGIAVAPVAYNASYYQQLFFDNPVNSINAQYAEMSGGLFRWVPAGAGVYGPFNVPERTGIRTAPPIKARSASISASNCWPAPASTSMLSTPTATAPSPRTNSP